MALWNQIPHPQQWHNEPHFDNSTCWKNTCIRNVIIATPIRSMFFLMLKSGFEIHYYSLITFNSKVVDIGFSMYYFFSSKIGCFAVFVGGAAAN